MEVLASLLKDPLNLGVIFVIAYLGKKFIDGLFDGWFQKTQKTYLETDKYQKEKAFFSKECQETRRTCDLSRANDIQWIRFKITNLERVMFHIGVKVGADEDTLVKLFNGGDTSSGVFRDKDSP